MSKVKVDELKVEEKVINLLDQTRIPVSIDFIASNIGIGWGTARAILLTLSLERKIRYLKTTKSWVFFLDNEVKQNGE